MSDKNNKLPQEKMDTGFDESYAKSEFTSNPLAGGGLDPYAVAGKNPARAYKWISFRQFVSDGHRDFRGWCALTKETISTETYNVDGDRGDGFVHKGSTILAFMPKTVYAKIQDKKRELVRNTTRAVKEGPQDVARSFAKAGYKNVLTVEDSDSAN